MSASPSRSGTPQLARALSLVLALIIVYGCAMSGSAHARIVHATPDDYRKKLATLKPGDTLQLSAGEYRRGLPIHRLAGTAAAPIVVRGPANGDVAVFVARPNANTVSILDASHVHIRDITIDGRNIAVDAVKAEGHARYAHHITLERLTIVNHGANQQIVAISTKCPAWGWIVRGNRIVGAGTGMYFGNSDGSAPFFDGVIENNLVTDPLGYAIQIKHQLARPDLDIAPRGRFVTVIRHNVLSKAGGGSDGPLARPNLLLGHWPRSGEGAQDLYLVYGNFLHENPHEALMQGEGNIAFYDNVAVNRSGPGIHIQPHNDVPRQVRILRNTVITGGDPIAVRLNEGTNEFQQSIAGNAVFSPRPITGGTQTNNLLLPPDKAPAYLSAAPDSARGFDPYPRNDQLRCAPLDERLLEDLIDRGCDFNGTRRTQHFCGAYDGQGRNPGWLPALTIKPRTICRK